MFIAITETLAANITALELFCDGALVATHIIVHGGYTSRENEIIAATHELLTMAGIKPSAF